MNFLPARKVGYIKTDLPTDRFALAFDDPDAQFDFQMFLLDQLKRRSQEVPSEQGKIIVGGRQNTLKWLRRLSF